MIVRPYGDRAVLVETDDVLGLARAAAALPGVLEVVPAARTVLLGIDSLIFDPGSLERLEPVAHDRPDDAPVVELDVHYDGVDLGLVAETAGCSVEEAIRRHTTPVYTVAFCGFAPGFAYLDGLHESLWQPRLDSPRTSVPGGSVGTAGEFTGVYPRASPGGWRLLGRTDAELWNLDRDPPAVLTPGTRVRFIAT
jgi:KipI family sensor histidine kinase inhibitor